MRCRSPLVGRVGCVVAALLAGVVALVGPATAVAGRTMSVAAAVADDDTAVPVVRAGDPQRLTLTSRTAAVPVTAVNEGDEPVDVVVRLSSDKLSFPDGSEVALTLEPGLNSFEVDVSARTSGDSLLVVRILTADGTLELDRTSLTIRSTALSGVGIAVAVVALVVLGGWWVRNHAHLRRDRRLVTVDEGHTSTAATDDHD